MKSIWDKISKYFSKQEFTDPGKMSGLLLLVLYGIRYSSGWKVVLHSTTGGKHCENSYHYKGLAADFHFKTPNGSLSFKEQVKFLQKYLVKMQFDNFAGLGATLNGCIVDST
ncbi:MAG: hypothetical protein U9Q89_00705 [Thermodesulfobacteriota bacterium]|nr:hypothetical protein [Thermodesulfobacteriota bacterium]